MPITGKKVSTAEPTGAVRVCVACGQIKPFESFRERCTPAQRRAFDKDFLTRARCAQCRPETTTPRHRVGRADKAGPVGLFKALTNAGLPPRIIEHRVAVRAAVKRAQRVKALRAAWAARYSEETQACLRALDVEVERVRYQERKSTHNTTLTTLTTLTNYRAMLRALRITIKRHCAAGKAPPDPWHTALTQEQKIQVRDMVNEAAMQPSAALRWVPVWWGDEDAPNHKPVKYTDPEVMRARVASRRLGKKPANSRAKPAKPTTPEGE